MPLIYDLAKTIDLCGLNKNIYADTNAIADLYYPNASFVPNNNTNSKKVYHAFIRSIFQANKQLYITAQTLMEMEYVFLKLDHRVYRAQNSGYKGEIKDFRSIPLEMTKRKNSYTQYYAQIFGNRMITCVETRITLDDVNDYLSSLDAQSMDSNDFILAEYCKNNNGIILTDDADFCSSLVGCDLITGNRQLIQRAICNGFCLAN